MAAGVGEPGERPDNFPNLKYCDILLLNPSFPAPSLAGVTLQAAQVCNHRLRAAQPIAQRARIPVDPIGVFF